VAGVIPLQMVSRVYSFIYSFIHNNF